MLITTLNQLITADPNIVFVGGVSEFLLGHKLESEVTDIDIVVSNTTAISAAFTILQFESNSPYSQSQERAYFQLNKFLIDIFVENFQDEHITTSSIKHNTLQSIIYFWERVKTRTTDMFFIKKANDEIERISQLTRVLL